MLCVSTTISQVSIPYGKGKVSTTASVSAAEPVSIPYGKGKDVVVEKGEPWFIVSIPYGKGKAAEVKKVCDKVATYQFPMGKVKVYNYLLDLGYNTYQFPMGKVKAISVAAIILLSSGYQFPMGKVKLTKYRTTPSSSLSSINSLWER